MDDEFTRAGERRLDHLKTRALDISIFGLLIILASVLFVSDRNVSKFMTKCGDFITQSLFL